MSDLYFNEENDLSEENTSEYEDFCSTILQPFLFEREQKKACGNERHDKEAQHIHASAAESKCRHCKNEAREIDCLCCREVNAMLIASAKIQEREGNISPSSFYGKLPDY